MVESAANVLRDARTVAVVVHGVGDHSASEILKEAEQHLAAAGALTRRLKLSGLPKPEESNLAPPASNETLYQQGLEVEIGQSKHVILPIVWSRFRLRGLTSTDRLPSQMGFHVLSVGAPALILLCLDSLRCVPRARALWKIAAAGLAVAVAGLIAVITWGAFYLTVHLPLWLGVAGTPDFDWYDPGILIGAFVALGWMLKRAATLLDFVGDVACYVGRDRIRDSLQSTVSTMVQAVAAMAPDARVLVIGHSLGSVLVSHALLKLPTSYAGSDRTILVSLGSPLRMMARLFPRHVLTPATLLDRFDETRQVTFWANLWRDGDVIGRSLDLSTRRPTAEISLGAGGHQNYWADGRLWDRISELLQATERRNIPAIRERWRPTPLAPDETWEISRRLKELKGSKWTVTLLVFIVLNLYMRNVFWSPWLWVESTWTLAALRAGWIVGFAAMIVHFWLVSWSLRPRSNEREWLGLLRLMVGVCRLTALAALIVVGWVGLYAIDPTRWSEIWPG